MLEFRGMRCTSLLPSHPCPLWSGVVALDRVLSMDQIELSEFKLYLCSIELFEIEPFICIIVDVI